MDKQLESVNPANDERLATYTIHTQSQVDAAVERAQTRFHSWRKEPLATRADALRRIAKVLRDNRQEYGLLITREMGKPISQAIAEVEKCATGCEHYAEQGPGYLARETVASSMRESFVSFEPLGVILAVMPWNFPFWQVFRFAAPAILAGNTCLLKHASNVSGCALAIEEIMRRADLPADVFQTLLLPSRDVEQLIRHEHIRAVTLTGSGPAGASVAGVAGSALKKSVLELGGNDAYVVLADADLELAARICATSRFTNAGQTCIAAKRLIVDKSVRDEFEQHLAREIDSYPGGDPEQEATRMGPLARGDLRVELQRQVDASVAAGARCVTGGSIPKGKGAYYPATLLTDVSASMPAFREELFGPVACVIAADNEQQAIALANDSIFGLGAAVFSRDIDRARDIAAHQLEAGICVVNDFVRSDPLLPFGGIKQSGYGRELSHFGIREFVNIKTVYLG